MEAGGLSEKRASSISLDRLAIHLEALDRLGYAAVNVADYDIQNLQKVAYQPKHFAYVSANLKETVSISSVVRRWIVVERHTVKIGVTGVHLGAHDAFDEPRARLASVIAEMKKNADVVVVLVYGDQKDVKSFMEQHPEIDIAVSNSHYEPETEMTWVKNKQLMLSPAAKGAHIIGFTASDLRNLQPETVSLINVELKEAVPDDADMHAFIEQRVKEQFVANEQKKMGMDAELLNLSPEEFLKQYTGTVKQ